VGEVLPLLNKKWVSIDDQSGTLFPLFETFESLVATLGPQVLPFAVPLFERSCRILAGYVESVRIDENHIYSKSNAMVRSMDLLSALFNALGSQSAGLVVQSDLLQALFHMIKFKDNTVK
jgi:hypothetical protein